MTFKQRKAMVQAYRHMIETGLGTGSSGNLSQRTDAGMIITPTGIPAATLEPSQLVSMTLEGVVGEGELLPSSEWHLHAEIYAARPDINALVHCHSRYATILACAHKPLPAIHYMIVVSGVDEIPLAAYATFGTAGLAASAVSAFAGSGMACLLANHGQVAAGVDLAGALRVAQEVEELAAIYYGCLAIGGGEVLSADAMAEVREAFAGYGQQRQGDSTDPR